MSSKKQKLPLEVSNWMEKDVSIRKVSANARLLTNDTRPNIILTRQYFSNLLNLSFSRYRKMLECDFEKRMFLKVQQNRLDSPSSSHRSTFGINRIESSRIQSSKNDSSLLINPSTQSFLTRSITQSDPTYFRKKPSISPRRKTAQPLKSHSETILRDHSLLNQRQMSRESLNRLAQPKGFRSKSLGKHVRTIITEEAPSPEDIFGKIDQQSEVTSSPMPNILPSKPKTPVGDKRFENLMNAFSNVHQTKIPKTVTVQSIINSNPSLQDSSGNWTMSRQTAADRKAQLRNQRQTLIDKLNSRLDIFLIDVAA